ncbi:MAG: asparagine synthase (glutamine-hydrolyzing), partial [Gammaproteobacteria bacterium]|nr:asparagine synthase (glutamine-hydrolyzing) [Gammaproteobacteria bacterium]
MCGIAGIFRSEAWAAPEVASLQPVLAAMGDRMLHRGPDDGGTWIEAGAYVGLSHRRLSIVDLSAAGHQPMSSWDDRYIVAFNGEIYNFLELRPELEAGGARFRTRTDTEVLIEAVRAWGLETALERFDGMFAFALYDRHTHELMLARDPFGEKPLYTMMRAGELAFASELTALRELPWFDDTCDEDALAEYLCFQYIGAPRSLYRSVQKLPPGHYARIRPGEDLKITRYFAFHPYGVEGEAQLSEELVDELEEILCRSLRRRLISDVPLGAFLSGGVDSSTVAALATRKLGVPLRTYSIGFEGAPESEHLIARRFAEHLGTEHHERMVTPDASRFLHEAGRHLDEPNGDTSCLPTY